MCSIRGLGQQPAVMLALSALVLFQGAAWAQEEETVSSSNGYRLGSQRTWPFVSFLKDEGDDASTLGIEFESYVTLGGYEVKNLAYVEVNQYPRAVPGQLIGGQRRVRRAGRRCDGTHVRVPSLRLSRDSSSLDSASTTKVMKNSTRPR